MTVSSIFSSSPMAPISSGTSRGGATNGSQSNASDPFGPAVQVSLSSSTAAIQALTKDGLSSQNVDYSGKFKQQIFNVADVNQDGSISQSELEQQVVAGGGTAADADSLYQAMGGTANSGVSEQQLSQSLATPSDNNFGDQLMKVVDPNGTMTKAELEQLMLQSGNTQQQANSLASDVGLT